jgi:hypothetical protein
MPDRSRVKTPFENGSNQEVIMHDNGRAIFPRLLRQVADVDSCPRTDADPGGARAIAPVVAPPVRTAQFRTNDAAAEATNAAAASSSESWPRRPTI